VQNTLLTIDEVAERLRVSYASANRLVQSGELPGFRVGRLWRVREADLAAYVDAKVQAARARYPNFMIEHPDDDPEGDEHGEH
jgi:excisionase family DNA binding protein